MSRLLSLWASNCGKLLSLTERKLADFVRPALKARTNSVKKAGMNNAAIVSGLNLEIWVQMMETNK